MFNEKTKGIIKSVIEKKIPILFIGTLMFLIIPGYVIHDTGNNRSIVVSRYNLTWSSDEKYIAFTAVDSNSFSADEFEVLYWQLSDNSIHSLGRFLLCEKPSYVTIQKNCINTPVEHFYIFYSSFVFSQNNKYLSLYLTMKPNTFGFESFKSTILVWNLEKSKLINKFEVNDPIQDYGFQRNTIKFSENNNDSSFITLDRDRKQIFDYNIDLNNFKTVYSSEFLKYSVQVNPNRSLIAFGSSNHHNDYFSHNNSLKVLNTHNGNIVSYISISDHILHPLDWSNDGNQLLISAGNINHQNNYKDSHFLIWDLTLNKDIKNVNFSSGSVRSWSNNFKKISFQLNNRIHIWNIQEPNYSEISLSNMVITPGIGEYVSLSPSGDHFVYTVFVNKINIYNLDDGSIEKSYIFYEFEKEIGLISLVSGLLVLIIVVIYKLGKEKIFIVSRR